MFNLQHTIRKPLLAFTLATLPTSPNALAITDKFLAELYWDYRTGA